MGAAAPYSFPTQIASLFLKQDNNITHDSKDLVTVINLFHSFNCKGYITNAIDVREGKNNTVYIVTCSVRYKILDRIEQYGLLWSSKEICNRCYSSNYPHSPSSNVVHGNGVGVNGPDPFTVAAATLHL